MIHILLGYGSSLLRGSNILKIIWVLIIGVFITSIILIPALFSYLPPPKSNHLKHLDFKFFNQSGSRNLMNEPITT